MYPPAVAIVAGASALTGVIAVAVAATPQLEAPASGGVVLIAAITSLGAVAVALINSRMNRQSANIAAQEASIQALREDADRIVERAERRTQDIAEQALRDIDHLRVEAADAHTRADRAESRAEEASERLIQLESKYHLLARKLTVYELYTLRLIADMRDHGLTPPPEPK